ncbi:MAG: serine hydrolase domain-containing protein [Candidatus Geothermincolia bacterium]
MLDQIARSGRKYLVIAMVLLFLASVTLGLSSCGGSPSFSKAIQDKLTSTVEKIMRDEKIPGAIVGIWQKGKGEYVKAFGKARLQNNLPMQTDFLWKIASVTKTFTADVVLQLVSEGKVGLEDKLSKYEWSTGLANRDQITVRMLLNHTSGYPDLENDDPAFQKIRFGDPTKVWTHEEILKWGRTLQPLFPPGQGYHYTNFGYYLLGMIIESATGKTATAEIETRCANKLGLKNTRLADMPAYILSKPHTDGYVMRDQAPPGIELPGKTNVVDAVDWNTTAGWTSAGVDSNLFDLKTWIEAVASGTLLTPAMRAEQLKNPIPMSDMVNTPRYGLGVAITKLPVGELRWHNGATLGYSTFAGSLADNSITIVICMNMMPTANGDSTPATGIFAPLLTTIQGQSTK